MEISTQTIDDVLIVALSGSLDSITSGPAQEQILLLIEASPLILLDMTELVYMSSSGLRTMLLLYRKITGEGGRIVLAGLRDEITDVMSATGFLQHFTVVSTVDEGLEALRE